MVNETLAQLPTEDSRLMLKYLREPPSPPSYFATMSWPAPEGRSEMEAAVALLIALCRHTSACKEDVSITLRFIKHPLGAHYLRKSWATLTRNAVVALAANPLLALKEKASIGEMVRVALSCEPSAESQSDDEDEDDYDVAPRLVRRRLCFSGPGSDSE